MVLCFYRSKLRLVLDRSEVFAPLELVPFVAITGNTATLRWESIDQTKFAPSVSLCLPLLLALGGSLTISNQNRTVVFAIVFAIVLLQSSICMEIRAF
jgi:hypothetical protein